VSPDEFELRSPQNATDWAQYHQIRHHVLFELRGRGDKYDPNHPDETAPGHFPLLLARGDDVLGVIRIDVTPPVAILRRVAIRLDRQREGLGTVLLAMAETFAHRHQCTELLSSVAPDAVPFYSRCGFRPVERSTSGSVPMTKRIGAKV